MLKIIQLGNWMENGKRKNPNAGRVYEKNGLCPTLTGMTGGNRQPMIIEDKTIKIKQATKQGYIECKVGGIADFSFPDSKLRRGRVQGSGDICPTLMAGNSEIVRIENKYRIRKLTPRECFRLMGVKDEDSQKMLDVNSNTQCYKQAGNSIVVQVLMGIFKQLL
jgi:DNA (cytosine-5)-methyltransferase 1